MSWFKSDASGERGMKDEFLDVSDALVRASSAAAANVAAARVPASAARARAAVETRSTPAPTPEAKEAAASAAKPPTSVLGSSLHFRGELRADEDFTLQGRIEGSIHHTQALTIGVDGVVKGDSRARSIVDEGTVEGDLYALESISVAATGRVAGNLFAPRVAIADGATFNGKIDMASATKAARAIVSRQSTSGLSERDADQMLAGVQGP